MHKRHSYKQVDQAYFPRQYARTLNYTLGSPRNFRISGDGRHLFFLRARASSERALDLWYMDLRSPKPKETLLIPFSQLNQSASSSQPDAERQRRERLREAAGGVTSYSISTDGSVIAFAVAGDLYVHLLNRMGRTISAPIGGATDVKVSPNGKSIAFVCGGELFVTDIRRSTFTKPQRISPKSSANVTWGLPDFIAAEEIHRYDGYWWSPDSDRILFAGVDETAVTPSYIASPSAPQSEPRQIRFPYAGTQNAESILYLWSRARNLVQISWDKVKFPYLVSVKWRDNAPSLVVQDRAQRRLSVLIVNQQNGATSSIYNKEDRHWIELIPGLPDWTQDSKIIDTLDRRRRQLAVDGVRFSQSNLEVRKLVGQLKNGAVVYLASRDPKETHVWMSTPSGRHTCLSDEPGVFGAEVGENIAVIFGRTLLPKPTQAKILDLSGIPKQITSIKNLAATCRIHPAPEFFTTPKRRIEYAVLYPKECSEAERLPVLVDPYGGPLIQRCVRSIHPFTISQWFADQGFIVVVADGRGTPGRGPAWEKAIHRNLLRPILEDQIEALDALLERHPLADRERVGIRGWSFGGYLSVQAVLHRPDRFHAAIAGAPVTDWRYYDTHYSERYLGLPARNQSAYDASSAIISAPGLHRPLLLIHGLSDDNVLPVHTFKLSQALFKEGKDHDLLVLTDVTHMTSSENASENLLMAELRFLQANLKAH